MRIWILACIALGGCGKSAEEKASLECYDLHEKTRLGSFTDADFKAALASCKTTPILYDKDSFCCTAVRDAFQSTLCPDSPGLESSYSSAAAYQKHVKEFSENKRKLGDEGCQKLCGELKGIKSKALEELTAVECE